MGLFSGLIKGIVRGARGIGGKIVKGLKGVSDKVVKGVKGGYQRVKQLVTGKKPKKDFVEGDPVSLKEGFVTVTGGKMAYKGGKPLTGKIIRDRGLGDSVRVQGEGSKTFSYIDNLTDPESILL